MMYRRVQTSREVGNTAGGGNFYDTPLQNIDTPLSSSPNNDGRMNDARENVATINPLPASFTAAQAQRDSGNTEPDLERKGQLKRDEP
mmetsp:Transcript_35699/g.53221  ORF Transcript_35699/g.53221 Transcript_35699/m.53221 type:complete len:88 (+) Transcript_35699:1134-1397(+)